MSKSKTNPKPLASAIDVAVASSMTVVKAEEDKKELSALIAHYKKQAMVLFNLTLGKEFKLNTIREHNKCTYADAKEFIRLLHQYGHINETLRNKQSYFKVTLDVEKRKANLIELKKTRPDFAEAIDYIISVMV